MLASILIDERFGEPNRWHPLVGFGKFAQAAELGLNETKEPPESTIIMRLKGVLALSLTCLPFVFIAAKLSTISFLGPIVDIAVLYLAIGAKSLKEHGFAVSTALQAGNLQEARTKVGLMVSRDTSSMNETDIVRATIESILENGNDAIFGSLFWFMVAGAPGVVLFRLVNTLDAMWGYKTPRYLYFGWAAARFDDLLNWLPARLTAITYGAMGNWQSAWECWRKQGKLWESPNAGPVLAAGAASLKITLGGPAFYHGELESNRPWLGQGKEPEREDINRSIKLVEKGIWLWVIVSLVGALINA